MLAELDAFFCLQPGYEPLEEIHKKPDVIAYKEELCSPSALHVEEEEIHELASTLIQTLSEALGDALIASRKQQLDDALVSFIKEYILSHPEYNSYSGFLQLGESDDFIPKMSEITHRIMNNDAVKDEFEFCVDENEMRRQAEVAIYT